MNCSDKVFFAFSACDQNGNIPELREPGRQAQCLRMLGAAMREES